MHENHRERMRNRFFNEGIDHFEEHQVLEMLLFYAIPRKDTNAIAHRLINEFGNFVNVMNASVGELEAVEGMGPSSAQFLVFIRSAFRYYGMCAAKEKPKADMNYYSKYLLARLNGKRYEEVHAMFLNGAGTMIKCVKISEGDACCADVPVGKIISEAVHAGSMSVILAHNHPNGSASPSKEDLNATVEVAKALDIASVYLADHIIVSDSDYVSLRESKLYIPEMHGIYRRKE